MYDEPFCENSCPLLHQIDDITFFLKKKETYLIFTPEVVILPKKV